MKDLYIQRETLDQMFTKIDENFKEIVSRLSKLEQSVEIIENDVAAGNIINGVEVTVDSTPTSKPSCEVGLVKVGNRSKLTMNFKGLRGSDGEQGIDGVRGTIIYVGTDTTSQETADRLTEMVGNSAFRVGDIFLNSKSFELKECTRGGEPADARFKLLGVLNGTSVDLGEQTGIFTGNKNQLTLGDGSVINISTFLDNYLSTIKNGLSYFNGGRNQLTLGNGEYINIGEFLTGNVEQIRSSIGVVTKDKAGLVPKLPIIVDDEESSARKDSHTEDERTD